MLFNGRFVTELWQIYAFGGNKCYENVPLLPFRFSLPRARLMELQCKQGWQNNEFLSHRRATDDSGYGATVR